MLTSPLAAEMLTALCASTFTEPVVDDKSTCPPWILTVCADSKTIWSELLSIALALASSKMSPAVEVSSMPVAPVAIRLPEVDLMLMSS